MGQSVLTRTLMALAIFAVCVATSAFAQDLQKGREAAAKTIHQSGALTGGPVALAIVAVRLVPTVVSAEQKPPSRGWWPFGSTTTSLDVSKPITDNFEVLAEDQLIDRFSMSPGAAVATVTDDSGRVVGYFRTWTTNEDSFFSAKGALTLYVVRHLSIAMRTVEFRCSKLKSQGASSVAMGNARWQPTIQQIAFDLSSTCYHVDISGPDGSRIFSHVTDTYGFDGKMTPQAWTNQQSRLALQFSPDGEIKAVGPFKPEDPKQREISRCREAGKTAAEFLICGTDREGYDYAFWRTNGRQHEMTTKCEVSQGKSHLVGTCNNVDETAKIDKRRRTVSFHIASANAPGPVSTDLECDCARLNASGSFFDAERRLLTFNLDTDATSLRFSGGEFAVPKPVAQSNDDKTTMEILVFEIQLNENWQTVGVTSNGNSKAQEKKK